jgi:hypothetical protein
MSKVTWEEQGLYFEPWHILACTRKTFVFHNIMRNMFEISFIHRYV